MYFFNIQHFADGEGTAPAADAGSGVMPAAAGQGLEALGVPKDRADKWAKSKARRGIDVNANVPQSAPTEADNGAADRAGAKASWDDILKDPDYKSAFDRQVQGIMQRRFAKQDADKQKMEKLRPALEFLATKYKLDTENLDTDALTAAIMKDDSVVENYADESGTSVEKAREMLNDKLELARLRRESKIVMDRQSVDQHLNRLREQAEEVKQYNPEFDVDAEIANNAAFARMTSPQIGMSVADAYFATHRKEILAARDASSSKQAIEAVANTIRAGQARPRENGVAIPATITPTPYSQKTKAERQQFKNELRKRWAAGEKPTPQSFR